MADADEGSRSEAGPAPADRLEYRPRTSTGLGLAAVLVVTAVILVWVGSVLTPDDVSTIDGFEGILFRFVPVRPFTWIMGAVFAALGVRIATKALRAERSLLLESDGLTLPDGRQVAWDQIGTVDADSKDATLSLMIAQGGVQDRIALSAFDLGASPRAVAEEISRRKGPRQNRLPSES